MLTLPGGLPGTAVTDDIDSYAAGSNMHGQPGWEGWGGDTNAGALVVTNVAISGANSIDINGAGDLVHMYTGHRSGQWVYRVMQYVPSASTNGSTSFIMLNSYPDGTNRSVQITMDLTTNAVVTSENLGGGATLPLIRDRWVELLMVIDLGPAGSGGAAGVGTVTEYYDGQVLSTHPWHDGAGINEIQALELFANGADTVYYDDVRLTVPLVEDFDSYVAGTNLHGLGTWEGWDGNPLVAAPVSDAVAHSGSNSVYVDDGHDVVHKYAGYDSGQLVHRAMVFAPTGSVGRTFFGLMHTYPGGGFGATTDFDMDVDEVQADAGTVPLIRDQWVEYRTEIDLDADTCREYYNGVLIGSHGWGGAELQGLDLWAPGGAGAIYYDDISLTPGPDGGLPVGQIAVTIKGDLKKGESPSEDFTVNLSNPSGAAIGDGEGVGTIEDDDSWRGTVLIVR